MSVLLCGRPLRLRLLSPPFFRSLAAATSTASRTTELTASYSFTFDFLTSSCGLSPAQALSAARTIRLDEKTRERPEPVLAVLRSHGFSDAHIADLVSRYPRILLCKTENNLGLKLQFLTQEGLSPGLIAQSPAILSRSLDQYLRPCFEFLHRFLSATDDLHAVLWRPGWGLNFNMKSTMIPNTEHLLELGVAAPVISRLIASYPWVLTQRHELFAEGVQIVQDWGVKPDMKVFPHALRTVLSLRKSNLSSKFELFKKLGWSEEEVIKAFRRSPLCITVSEQKIMRINCFARKLGLGPSDLSRQPALLMYSFDKRILPRYAVWQVLTSKGLIEQRTSKLTSMFVISEERFMNGYVKKYMDNVPEVMDVYLGKIKAEGPEIGCDESRNDGRICHIRGALTQRLELFVEGVQIVQDWGVKPDMKVFLHTLRIVCTLHKSSLFVKLELFKKLGWAEEEVLKAFRKSPLCIVVSELKMVRINSFAKELGLGPSDLSRQPALLMYNFNGRILTRYAVWQILKSEGLIEQRTNKHMSMFVISGKLFMNGYVKKYMDEVPEVMDVYLGKIKAEGLDIGGDDSRSSSYRESVSDN
ncbi:hypothetical protein Taro_026507 [Colocasia esculenta]|uniref:Uncharacterized protein n=1 Tax=Colocasia esculenta TaxID=4460 RepID=A0A843VJQ8_COLES|nr:hypothetical protein [Colocasia esculenta]